MIDASKGLAPNEGRVRRLWVLLSIVGLLTVGLPSLAEPAAASVCIPTPPGLISWWPAEGSANDLTAANNGTLEGAASFATVGQVGQAFSFDGVDDFVNVPDSFPSSSSLDGITSAITVDAWINPTAAGAGYIFARRDPLSSEGFSVAIDNEGRVAVVVRTTTSPTGTGSVLVSAPGVVTFDQFQHIAVTANTSTGLVKAYVNGQQAPLLSDFGPATLSGSLSNVNGLFIGRRQSSATPEGVPGSGHYRGLVDELDVYSAELSQAEIQSIFDAGTAGKCRLPVPLTLSVDPRRTHLRTSSDAPLDALKIDLAALGISSGSTVRLEQLGAWSCGPCQDTITGMTGVFSAGDVLLPSDQSHRVPGAIDAGDDMGTGPTPAGGFPTDIPEDFSISDTTIEVPSGATHLFVGALDIIFFDNSDPNGDFRLRISTVVSLPVNQPPIASVGGPYTAAEGGSVALSGSGSDPDGDSITYDWDLDNNGTFETPGQNASFSAAGRDGLDSQVVSLRVCDGNSACATSGGSVTINNVAPSATLTGASSANEGDTKTYSYAATDPGDDTITWNLGCGGGGDLVTGSDTGTEFTCSFPDGPANPLVNAIASDEDGDSDMAMLGVGVANAAPVATITAPGTDSLLAVGTVVNLSASFTDDGDNDTHACSIDWGDGTPATMGSVTETTGDGTCTAGHTYAAGGLYTISATTTDDDNGSDTESVGIVVYDPSEGFVTGGGWIDSPAGAYAADTSLAGRANFGFVSKYFKGATTPSGQTEFRFDTAGLRFHGSSYDWLVVSGAKGQFKGSGTVNGVDGYGFLLTANDGQVTGGGGTDRFRIKIWEVSSGNLVYDNQVGAANGDDATTALVGGQIMIHKK